MLLPARQHPWWALESDVILGKVVGADDLQSGITPVCPSSLEQDAPKKGDPAHASATMSPLK